MSQNQTEQGPEFWTRSQNRSVENPPDLPKKPDPNGTWGNQTQSKWTQDIWTGFKTDTETIRLSLKRIQGWSDPVQNGPEDKKGPEVTLGPNRPKELIQKLLQKGLQDCQNSSEILKSIITSKRTQRLLDQI